MAIGTRSTRTRRKTKSPIISKRAAQTKVRKAKVAVKKAATNVTRAVKNHKVRTAAVLGTAAAVATGVAVARHRTKH